MLQEPEAEHRTPLGAAGQDVADLRRHDARQGQRGRAPVEVPGRGHRQARPPAGEPVGPEEGAEREGRLGHAEEAVGVEQPAPAQEPLGARARGPVHHAGLGSLRAERERREEVRAEVDGEDLHHGQREGDPRNTNARNGTSSGTLEAKMYVMNFPMLA